MVRLRCPATASIIAPDRAAQVTSTTDPVRPWGTHPIMTITTTRIVALAAVTLVLAACAGTASGTGAPTAAIASQPAVTVAPSVAPGASAPTDASAAPSVGLFPIPSFDLSGLIQGLANVDSYKVAITSGGAVTYTATVVTKPVLARDIHMEGTHIVIVGDKAWQGEGDKLTPIDAGIATTMLSVFDPALLVGGFGAFANAAGSVAVGEETKNGVQAQHFRIDSSSPIAAFASFPPDAAIDIWIAKDGGYLVSLATTNTGSKDFTMDVTNVDDPANQVDTPS